jgi:hypothetical protein
VIEDGDFKNIGGVIRWSFQFLTHTSTSLTIISCCFTVAPLFAFLSRRLGIAIQNTIASKNCVKLLKPPKTQIPTPITSFQIC